MILLRNPIIFTVCIIILSLGTGSGFAQNNDENLNVLEDWLEWSNADNLLETHLYSNAYPYLDAREALIAKYKTKADWLKRQQEVKERLLDLVGPFPEKSSLNPRITGTLHKPGYSVEKIIFESMPDYHVTGDLFIPEGRGKKSPTILFLSGHSLASFRRDLYQLVIHNLVKKGFIVFAIDPMGQGERIQYTSAEKVIVGLKERRPTHEHSYANNQCLLSGVSAARYWTWDGIRAIDYLMTREEVDKSRIGVHGHSGGGTQTAFIAAFDERVKAAASSGYICGYRHLLSTIGPQDGEQIFINGIANGLDHADLIEVFAPKPYLIVSTTRDFFSIQGARETFAEAKKAYQAMGSIENLSMAEDDHRHGYTRKNRESIYGFFQHVFNVHGNRDEEDPEILAEEELNVTPTGQLQSSVKGNTISDANKSESQTHISNIKRSRKDIDSHLQRVLSSAKKLSGYKDPDTMSHTVFRGRYLRDGYSVEMWTVSGEGDYVMPLLLYVPDGSDRKPAMIFLDPDGKASGDSSNSLIEGFVKHGFIVAAADLIGNGETKIASDYPGRPAYGAILLGRSMVGIHAGDIKRIVNVLKIRDDVNPGHISALASGELAPALLHAASFIRDISSVLLIGAPLSYSEIISHRLYKYSIGFQWGVAGALTEYDLPDLAASIAPRKLILSDMRNAMNVSAAQDLLDKELAFPRSVYAQMAHPHNLKVIDVISGDTMKSIIEWIKK